MPLADRIRPATLNDVVGQSHLIGKNRPLTKIIESGRIPNMIFYGPSGVGKTTVARIIADSANMRLHKLNGTNASTADIKSVVSEVDTFLGCNGILLYLDEIQYFNKKQQQSLLEYLEDGRITLIASTTENPYYYIYDALLSRCSVFEFKHVPPEDIEKHIRKVAAEAYPDITLEDGAAKLIADSAAGDVRRALTMLEVAVSASDDTVSRETVEGLVPTSSQGNFDRDGDVHYDLLAGLQKSIRGSDPDAAVFYLARLLEGGDLISPCRRLMVIASEDIGLAYPMAPVIVKSCIDCAREVGLPEAKIPLVNATVMLATAPKSNSAYTAYARAAEDIKAGRGVDIPKILHSPLFKGYKYPHDYPNHWVAQQYLPDDLKDRKYYEYGENKTEAAAKAYWEKIKK